MIYPAITLYQPWATWIMKGWKKIETRTHNRFSCLKGQTILIHAGLTTDKAAMKNPYLFPEQIQESTEDMVNGFILGLAFVYDFRKLCPDDSAHALIECATERWGLLLKDIQPVRPIPARGEMGIWYFDMDKNQKVKKPNNQLTLIHGKSC